MSTQIEPVVTYRRLPVGEFERLRPVYEEMGEPFPIPENTVMYVAEQGDEIVGYIAGQVVVYVSPLWVKKEFRGKGVAEKLAADGYQHLPRLQKVLMTRSPHVEKLAYWLGFEPKLGKMFLQAEVK
jgi:ribosomal protein S18 acetylase RimI-like enzyme